MFSFTVLVSNPVALIVAVALLETDHVPPGIWCVYCVVLFPQIVAAPAISIFAVALPTILEEVPVLVKLVKVPFDVLFALLVRVEIEVFVPPATPSLKSK